MEDAKIISGKTSEEIWRQIESDFLKNPDLFEYTAVIEHNNHAVILDIDIDLGGGFEGGYALTRFLANLKSFDSFRFSLHPQDFIDSIGKLIGTQDVLIGYHEFDKKMVIKTNDAERLKDIFSEPALRNVFLSLPDFTFHIGHHHSSNTSVEGAFLELRIEDGITDMVKLRSIYEVFLSVLNKLELHGKALTDMF